MRNDTPIDPHSGEERADGPNTDAGQTKPRDPDCFEQWLCERMLERRDRQDEVGRVARWVLRENREGRWAPGTILLARYGHAYDVPAHYERILRHAASFSEDAVQAFFRVYDLYLADDGAEYDRMVEERGRKLDEEFSGRSNYGCATPGPGADRLSDGFDWLSWNQFYDEILGPEQVGHEIDEDGWPLEEEPTNEGRE